MPHLTAPDLVAVLLSYAVTVLGCVARCTRGARASASSFGGVFTPRARLLAPRRERRGLLAPGRRVGRHVVVVVAVVVAAVVVGGGCS